MPILQDMRWSRSRTAEGIALIRYIRYQICQLSLGLLGRSIAQVVSAYALNC